MFKEFKEFAVKGNVMDMAVGVIIGAAFGKIVTALVGGIIMPIVSLATGGVSFSHLYYPLDGEAFAGLAADADGQVTLQAAEEAGIALLKYGEFIQTVVDFTIIAFCIFLMVKAINNAKKAMEKEKEKVEQAPAEPPAQEKLLTEIRDLLKKG